jgi:CubicO group peptidase (beta-lactamase class C family)
MKIFTRILVSLLVILALGVVYLWLKPPDLLRVGASYSAKIVCSNVFLAGRDAEEVLRTDVQAPGVSLLKLMRVSVDQPHGVVRAGLLGFIGHGLAEYRRGTGCTALPDGKLDVAVAGEIPAANSAAMANSATPGRSTLASGTPSAAAPEALWPEGTQVDLNPAYQSLLSNDALAGPGMRGVVVISQGRVVAERYAPGFTKETPLLGWSMSKTVTAALVGLLVKDGKLSLEQAGLWPAGDGRERIRIADLLAMSSGLRFNEEYGAVSDVTRMLYLVPDTAGFARAQPLIHPVGEVWSYSSGTANIVSRLVQDTGGGPNFVQERLFKPLRMQSAVIEPDEYGTFVGSSYMYATARDWARFGQFLLQNGEWQGQSLLPAGYVDTMASPVAASAGEYGHGFVWLWGSDPVTPGKNPDTAFGIPADTFYLSGHDGQTVSVIRSRQLVIVRLGLTPYAEHYSPQRLIQAVLDVRP